MTSSVLWQGQRGSAVGLDQVDRPSLEGADSPSVGRSNQSASWELKSAGEAELRPGMKEVSKNPLRRSTTPMGSGPRTLS